MSFNVFICVLVAITTLSQKTICDESSGIEATLDDIEFTLDTLTTSFSDNPENLNVIPELLTGKTRPEIEYLMQTINWLLNKLDQSSTSKTSSDSVNHYDVLQYIMFSLVMILFILKFIKRLTTWFNQ